MSFAIHLLINHPGWALFAASEAMALLPTQYKGIVQSAIKFIVDLAAYSAKK